MLSKDDIIWRKNPSKYKWEYCTVITLLTLLGVNNCQPLLHMSKTFIFINTEKDRTNQFAIRYMTNPTLHVNKVFRNQVLKLLKETFHQSTMKGIRMLREKRIYAL